MLARGARAVGRRPPGGRARYTNVGYLVAGRVVAEAAGMPFESYVEEAVLRPAGMGDTAFAVPGRPRGGHGLRPGAEGG